MLQAMLPLNYQAGKRKQSNRPPRDMYKRTPAAASGSGKLPLRPPLADRQSLMRIDDYERGFTGSRSG